MIVWREMKLKGSSKDIINFYNLIYPETPYRYWVSDSNGKTYLNTRVHSGKALFNKYTKIAELKDPYNHYISVNSYTLNEVYKSVKSGEISKLVIDLDDKNNPDATIVDARKLVELFNEMDYDVIPIKTGQKGIHLHLKLRTLKHPQIDKAIKSLFTKISNQLNITTMDMAVMADQTARVTRLPGSYHTSTGNTCVPIDIYSAETIEDMDHLDITDLTFNTGNNTLEKAIRKYSQSFKPYKVPKPKLKSKAYGLITPDKFDWFIMDKIFPDLYEHGQQNGDKYTVSCPFHDDKHPSAFYTDRVFHCSTCDISMGVWNLLTEHAGYDRGDAMRLIKKYQ